MGASIGRRAFGRTRSTINYPTANFVVNPIVALVIDAGAGWLHSATGPIAARTES